ncbi:hypothetical protein [Corynebacterium parakroppenstedtii]|uniref:hypothetical protein n=1 Tax=Corynebacterium parakroppenstedtii TaxID=2828363 RepID=UPI001C8D7FAF|nr:hypothetical protein [Corynebacterium parakroppenstedtii]MBY0797886.1 hypothetical protein [Corynebacterium parakroppenstedtii]
MTKALRAVIYCLLFTLVLRGLDYVTGTADGHAESDLPPLVWGTTCIVVGIVVVVGLVSRQTRIIIAGSLMASAIYVMFAVYQVPLIFRSSPPDDWRTCGDYVALAGLWAVVCVTLALRFHVAQARRGGDSGDVAGVE